MTELQLLADLIEANNLQRFLVRYRRSY